MSDTSDAWELLPEAQRLPGLGRPGSRCVCVARDAGASMRSAAPRWGAVIRR